MFSAMYAAENTVYPANTAARSLIPMPLGKNSGNMMEKKNSTVINGTPRTTSI